MDINYQAPSNPLGYGVAGLQIALALHRAGHKVAWWPIGHVDIDQNQKSMVEEMVDNQARFNIHAPSVRVWHQFDMAQHIGRGIHCGFPIFELTNFNDREKYHLNSLDWILVCSDWAKHIVRANLRNRSGDTIGVVPLGVDRTIFHENVATPQSGWTTFLNIGKWEIRKGHDILVEAFNKAFQPRDRVRLWMMNHNPFLSESQTNDWQRKYALSKLGSKISFLPRVKTHSEVARIMGEANCGVFPSRAEGWNLELLEMMSVGKHVITTNYSAHTEFCDNTNCSLIDIDTLEDAEDGLWFHNQGQWAHLGSPQLEQLITAMRKVHQCVQGGELINTNGINTAQRFTWENSAERLITSIKMSEVACGYIRQ